MMRFVYTDKHTNEPVFINDVVSIKFNRKWTRPCFSLGVGKEIDDYRMINIYLENMKGGFLMEE